MSSEHELDEQGGSYVYSKYSLPRGRMVDRESLPLESMMPTIDFNSRAPPPVNPVALPIRTLGLEEASRSSSESLPTRRPPPPIDLGHQHRHSMTSMNTSNTSNSASTIKASKHNPTPSNSDMTAEAHLEKGIALHEKGSLKESTYHLRLAAKRNNPTAMLLFALACRHGWGMRQSPSEGVAWLRKAIDYANVAMNESEHAEGAPSAIQRTKRAQFALGVYELGVSHMNGWGVDNDKVLALRCFEIASAWGDADAMAEAGFCYYQGVGCKKDLKKAATYYRQAEAKGVSMVGNSW
jgi:TPR repeat protein